ncbi:pyruvate, phosphate dikinase [Nocardioides sp. W7]|uniref:pyruvate, phosphate dikinase n=1 Tax=Nocardioides sp. W7 TaxID=2931390 RepID=UPI001FD4480F|nr:pyruvate, phosphate dikinase [Nocardioides sp. W7]
MDSYVFDFTVGDRDQADLLGGKGANLAEMTRLGLPVPPGFTITTEACRAYLAQHREPAGLAEQVDAHLRALEERVGRRLGDPEDPLLVSVRSGARFSMPGMMDTVLDVGLHDGSVAGLAARSGDERFAADSYRRLVQMFGSTVLGVPGHLFADELARRKAERGAVTDLDLSAEDLLELVERFKAVIREQTGGDFPQDPHEQLRLAIHAVFASWNTPRAALYRHREHIADDLGTAVNVQAMVFGNRGSTSGSGVCFTRDPATGERGRYGDYLPDAQGEDVVAGIRNTLPLSALEELDPTSYAELLRVMDLLEQHYRDLCDLEFTVEDGRLWMLQTRVGKRTPQAAVRIASDLVDEGLIDLDEAVRRITGAQVAGLLVPRFAPDPDAVPVTTGMGASPGAAVGRVVLDSETAVAWAERGEQVILVRQETTPDDLPGLVAAQGVLTSRGGKTSHAAVVARGMGRTCVCGADAVEVDLVHRRVRLHGGPTLAEGDVASLDGATGEVFLGARAVSDSVVVRRLSGEAVDDPVADALDRLLRHADQVRRLTVRANADTPADALRARRLGAAGIGLCRTEHMFLGERRRLVEDLVVATDHPAQEAALAALLPLQRADFAGILEAMDGLPVTVRLIDPPLHEFLPDLTELAVTVALEDERHTVDEHDHRLLRAVRRLHEQNPMLGLRGVRLGILIPGLFAMQARALLEATADRLAAGGDPRPEIMVPLVATETELALVRTQLEAVVAEVQQARGFDLTVPIGTMIELPRAALVADRIAASADFFSFGTNDLTQMTWGFSRDDVEASFLPTYLAQGVVAVSPFESIDVDGVGSLVRTAAELGRRTRPELHLGVCGEHGGDPASIHFFDELGLDYVSCSPFRVPVARWEAARSSLGVHERAGTTA